MTGVSDVLSLFSELAIGFLAFTALITVIADARTDDTSPRAIASGSVTVPIIFLLASAIPFAYLSFTPMSPSAWRIASGILLVVWVIDYFASVFRTLQDAPHLRPKAVREIVVVVLLCYLPIGANVIGLIPNPQDGYVLGLCILLVTSCLMFARVVRIVVQVQFGDRRDDA